MALLVVAGVVVMHVADDHVLDLARINAYGFEPCAYGLHQLAATRRRGGGIETEFDLDPDAGQRLCRAKGYAWA